MKTEEILQLQQKLRTTLLENGVADVGFCALKPADLTQMERDGFGAGGCRYGMAIAVRLSDAVVEEIDTAPTHTYFHHYRTVNTFIDQMVLQAGMMLAQHGFRYIPVAASQSINKDGWNYQGRFSHKQLACRCGLGTIGKSALFLHRAHGPRVRLGSLFTDCPFPDQPVTPESICGDCSLCAEACPAGAISGKPWREDIPREAMFDPKKCSRHMKTAYQHIGRGAVCGICMRVCPRYQNPEQK